MQSATAVLQYMDKAEYEPVPVGITHTGDWFYYTGEVEKIADDSWCRSTDCIPVKVSLNRGEHSLLLMKEGGMERIEIDAALPVLPVGFGQQDDLDISASSAVPYVDRLIAFSLKQDRPVKSSKSVRSNCSCQMH